MPKRRACACACDLGDAGARYAECCGRFHAGAEPAEPTSLMRSRYAAFVRGDLDYLWRTLHPDHEDRARPEGAWRAGLQRSLRAQRFRRLRILDARDADASGAAQVLFHVTMKQGLLGASFAERSLFARDDEGWRYLTGDLVPQRKLPRPLEALTLERFDGLVG
ncbi:MAG: YchJ family metal-binding protein [Myxococcota bacterium]